MKKMRMWIVNFYVYDPDGYDYTENFFIKVREVDLQRAVTKACHLIDKKRKNPKAKYFVHNVGLTADNKYEEEIRPDPLVWDSDDFEW